jgi:hypothetical protein
MSPVPLFFYSPPPGATLESQKNELIIYCLVYPPAWGVPGVPGGGRQKRANFGLLGEGKNRVILASWGIPRKPGLLATWGTPWVQHHSSTNCSPPREARYPPGQKSASWCHKLQSVLGTRQECSAPWCHKLQSGLGSEVGDGCPPELILRRNKKQIPSQIHIPYFIYMVCGFGCWS